MADAEFDMNKAMRSRFLGEKAGRTFSSNDLDDLISDVFPKKHQRKMSRVIWDVCEASDKYFSADEVACRLMKHVKAGQYAGYGNLEGWGTSEVGSVKTEP